MRHKYFLPKGVGRLIYDIIEAKEIYLTYTNEYPFNIETEIIGVVNYMKFVHLYSVFLIYLP